MDFSTLTVTNAGHALMGRMLAGEDTCRFTAIRLSQQSVEQAQIPQTQALEEIMQSAEVARVVPTSETAVQIEGAVDNRALEQGYFIRSVGIYARDKAGAEILYAVAVAGTPAYMPPYNGITVSGGYFKFVVSIASAKQVDLTVDPAAYATVGDVKALREQLEQMQARQSAARRIDIVLPAEGWEDATEEAGEGMLYADVTQEGVTEEDVPLISVLPAYLAEAAACGLSPSCRTAAGAVRVYAQKAPETEIHASLLLLGTGTN